MTKSIASLVQEKLEQRPYLLNALGEGFANASAVSRILHKEISLERRASPESVRAAVKRFTEKNLSSAKRTEDRIMRLLRNSKLELSTKMAVVVLERTRETEHKIDSKEAVAVIKSANAVTVILSDDSLDRFLRHFREMEVLVKSRNLVALTIVSPANLEDTPGVVAFVTGKLANRGINIREFCSSYTDTVVLLEKKDALKAFNELEKLLR